MLPNAASHILCSCFVAEEINREIVQHFQHLPATGFLTRFSQSALEIHNKSYRKQQIQLALSIYSIFTLGKFCRMYRDDLLVNIASFICQPICKLF
jgi:hypothetical protein